MRDAGIGDVRDPNGPESRPRHLGAKCPTRGPNDYRRNRMLRRSLLAGNCMTITFERMFVASCSLRTCQRRCVAGWSRRRCSSPAAEESPGSMGGLPGNAWASAASRRSRRTVPQKTHRRRGGAIRTGKGEKVG